MPAPLQQIAPAGQAVTDAEVQALVAGACPAADYRGRRVLLIIPDGTRTAPVGLMFKTLFAQLGGVVEKFDVMIALGTHPAMSAEAINRRVEITAAERAGLYRDVEFINHEWDNPAALRDLGVIPSGEISALSGGLFAVDVPVHINRRLFDYDQLIICGPVFPHEVVGFSGGNKYLFPGVAGPGILNFFHWLGAVVTNPMIIGNKWTPVRRVVDRAGAMVPLPKLCFCMVVQGHGQLAGLFAGTPEAAWDAASELSQSLHITHKDRAFHTVLSCAPTMYDELWVGGKCMYKLEPIVADGGELIIYAPHIHEVSAVHGHHIERLGYHCVQYFLKQWDRFKDEPWGTLAHCTHVYGIGTYDEQTGIETPRIRVTLATGIPEETCRRINLGYRDWHTIDKESFANRESEGVFYESKAGERLYHLRSKPAWAGGSVSPVNLILFTSAEAAAPLLRTDLRAVHLLDVLRRKIGDTFDTGLVNGPRGKGTITGIDAATLTLAFNWGSPPPPPDPITLIVGLPRPQTARDILRETTALGLAALHFVTSKKGESSYAQSTLWTSGEWHRHLVNGAQQAFVTQLPHVTHGRSLAAVLAELASDSTRLALDNYESPAPLSHAAAPRGKPVVLALGSERGWSAAERTQLREAKFQLVHLGPNVLRTETACIAALTLIKAQLGSL